MQLLMSHPADQIPDLTEYKIAYCWAMQASA
jgi:hypothetical protein